MLTKLTIRNFKRLREVEVPLAQAVVFIGPNNSGKTTALQALALWDIGLRSWLTQRGGKASPEKRPGVTINRRDLIALPIPAANLLWNDLHVRESQERKTRNIRIDIIVEGETAGKPWSCGLEFDYTSDEALICRPVRQKGYENKPVQQCQFSEIPEVFAPSQDETVFPEKKPYGCPRLSYLPPMSGLAAVEPKIEPGRVDVLLGEGQTAQVLRNLCHSVYTSDPQRWDAVCKEMQELFHVEMDIPEYISQRGEIVMRFREHGRALDISSAGRGAQQTLLLLAYLNANPNAVMLLDEPDAHLELLRQRQIYNRLVEIARLQGSQIIAASHSSVVLNEAAGRDMVVAFVGKPHELTGGKSAQVLKALRDIGFEQYYEAEHTGWVLYLEDNTDLPLLTEFARKLGHAKALEVLQLPFVHYLSTNLPHKAREHFHGLREAKPDLVGVALFDRLPQELKAGAPLREMTWRKREIESYLCSRDVLLRYAEAQTEKAGPLFEVAQAPRRRGAMEEAIVEIETALSSLGRPSPWSDDCKVSDDFLVPLFRSYSKRLDIPLCLRKNQYSQLVSLMKPEEISPEVREKLDAISEVASRAKPALEEDAADQGE